MLKRTLLISMGAACLLSLPIAGQWAAKSVSVPSLRMAQAAEERVYVASRSARLGGREVGEVLINDDVVFRIRSAAGGYSAPERARVVAERLSELINSGELDPNDIYQSEMNGERVLMANGELIITADRFHANVNRTEPSRLASTWERNLVVSLGGPQAWETHLASRESGRYGAASLLGTATPELDTKIVPILSAGTGIRLGAAQVTGPKRDAQRVQAVAEVETEFRNVARARLYIPISNLNVLQGIDRVPRVGVSGLADVRLKF